MTIDLGERMRVAACFGVLGCAGILLLGRLASLQLRPSASALAKVRVQKTKTRWENLPAPRGTILDRDGEVLAYDRPIYEVRAEVELTGRLGPSGPDFGPARDQLIAHLCWALGKGASADGDPGYADRTRAALERRLDRRIAVAADAAERAAEVKVDFLVDRGVEDAEVIRALRSLDSRKGAVGGEGRAKRPYFLALHLMRRFERVYPAAALAAGIVGNVRAGRGPGGDGRIAVSGLERLACLRPAGSGVRSFLVNSRGAAFWTAAGKDPDEALTLRTTFDLDLQRAAGRELDSAVAGVVEKYGSPPAWGAMVLIDVRDGGILAMASYQRGKDGRNDPAGAFAPTQRVFEPGSVVKPLVLALVLERGAVRQDDRVNCAGGYTAGSDRAPPGVSLPRREIRDTHACGLLTLREVIINSSNIGAVRLGLSLGAAGIEEYLRFYQYGEPTGILLPGEQPGGRPDERIQDMPLNERLVYTAPSMCFGYQLHVTPLQLARAFLTLVSGRQRALRLVTEAEADGRVERRQVADRGAPVRLSAATRAVIIDAMVGVAAGEEGSTARALAKILAERAVPPGTVAGKTGTSEYAGTAMGDDGIKRKTMIRTASFVGLAPAAAPRYLAVCVVQKEGAASFYGGRYAAPAAGRLLLTALGLD